MFIVMTFFFQQVHFVKLQYTVLGMVKQNVKVSGQAECIEKVMIYTAKIKKESYFPDRTAMRAEFQTI